MSLQKSCKKVDIYLGFPPKVGLVLVHEHCVDGRKEIGGNRVKEYWGIILVDQTREVDLFSLSFALFTVFILLLLPNTCLL